MKAPPLMAAAAAAVLLLAGCTGIPADALKLGPDSLANRQMQTRSFQTAKESEMLSTCAAVLQDLGFTLEESETKLGVIVASKERSAVNPIEATFAILNKITSFGIAESRYAKRQVFRASLVIRPAAPGADQQHSVRVTFQRRVFDNYDRIILSQQLNDPRLYEEFYARLAKSVALETLSP
jgi:hypothetical protein